jgi:hypothetical protein
MFVLKEIHINPAIEFIQTHRVKWVLDVDKPTGNILRNKLCSKKVLRMT